MIKGILFDKDGTLIDFYKEKNLLSTVDGTKAINEVFESICNILGSAN